MHNSRPPGECVLTDAEEVSTVIAAPLKATLPHRFGIVAAADRNAQKSGGAGWPRRFWKRHTLIYTVSVTMLLVTLPAVLVILQRYW